MSKALSVDLRNRVVAAIDEGMSYRQAAARFEDQPGLDPSRLVFIDETGATTKMARRHGRAPRGQRLKVSVPYGHWKTTTFVGGLRLGGMTAP